MGLNTFEHAHTADFPIALLSVCTPIKATILALPQTLFRTWSSFHEPSILAQRLPPPSPRGMRCATSSPLTNACTRSVDLHAAVRSVAPGMSSRSPERRRSRDRAGTVAYPAGAYAHKRRLSQTRVLEEGTRLILDAHFYVCFAQKKSLDPTTAAAASPPPPLPCTAAEDRSAAAVREWGAREAARCDGGDPDLELCELPEVLDSVPPAERTTVQEAISRGRWLVGLLVLQSSSSFILDSYQELIKQHLVVTLFLTMLVGAGGNAGNQSAIKVIRGLATGTIKPTGPSIKKVLKQQVAVALMLGTGLSAAGWVRVYVTNGDALNSTAIAISLFLIVCTSVLAGTALPFGLAKAGVDPANAGTSIQVIMDCLGVLITCVCCHYVLDTFAAGVASAGAVAAAVVQ